MYHLAMNFKDKVIIITGASSGIGRALSFRLAKQGAKLVLASRNRERLEELAKELKTNVLVVPTDVADETQCQQLIDKTIAEFGQIDILINNAGFGVRGNFDEFEDLTNFKKIMDVNYYGAVYCTRFALPYLKKTNGQIVGVSSIFGKIGYPGCTTYCASKFALAGFYDALRVELLNSKAGVSITMIYPGLVATGFAENMIELDGNLQGEKGRNIYTKSVMSADRCAEVIVKAVIKRKRQVVLTYYGVIGVWLNFFWPTLLDRIICFVKKKHKQAIESKT